MSESKCLCSCSDSESNCASNVAYRKVYACAGASNVGKMSLELAIALHRQNSYQMSCATGVGADICGFTESAKDENTTNLLIDGCPIGCLKMMFDKKGITNYNHVIVTQMGIRKEGTFDYDPEIIPQLLKKITEKGLS